MARGKSVNEGITRLVIGKYAASCLDALKRLGIDNEDRFLARIPQEVVSEGSKGEARYRVSLEVQGIGDIKTAGVVRYCLSECDDLPPFPLEIGLSFDGFFACAALRASEMIDGYSLSHRGSYLVQTRELDEASRIGGFRAMTREFERLVRLR